MNRQFGFVFFSLFSLIPSHLRWATKFCSGNSFLLLFICRCVFRNMVKCELTKQLTCNLSKWTMNHFLWPIFFLSPFNIRQFVLQRHIILLFLHAQITMFKNNTQEYCHRVVHCVAVRCGAVIVCCAFGWLACHKHFNGKLIVVCGFMDNSKAFVMCFFSLGV